MKRSNKILDGKDDLYAELIHFNKMKLLNDFEATKTKLEIINNEQNKNEKLYYPNQEETAKKVADIILNKREVVFQLIMGLTQTGKTACMLAVIDQILLQSGCDMLLNSDNIFIITGLSSINWREQTKDRMPSLLVNKVYMRNQLKDLKDELDNLGERKKDILILFDEVHIASEDKMTLGKDFLRELGFKDMNKLRELNINFVQFSATPDQILTDLKKWNEFAEIHKMKPGKGYKGLKEMIAKNRLFQAKQLYIEEYPNGNKKSKQKIIKANVKAIEEIKKKLNSKFKDNKYHMVRIEKGLKTNIVIDGFKKVFGDEFNYERCYGKYCTELLKKISVKPDKPTFIFIKDHLRCAVTLKPKENIGILYDRITKNNKINVIVQSLAGRATGYDVPDDIIVYSDIKCIKKYIEQWDTNFEDFNNYSKNKKLKRTIVDPGTYKNSGITIIPKINKNNDDFEYRVFDDDKEALKFSKDKSKKNMRKCNKKAPATLLQNKEKNPNLDYVIKRKYGLDKKSILRQVRLNTGQVCVYWRPSLLKKDLQIKS